MIRMMRILLALTTSLLLFGAPALAKSGSNNARSSSRSSVSGNTNANKNANANQNKNANASQNTNANKNTNANANKNTNVNANKNTNVNQNTNVKVNNNYNNNNNNNIKVEVNNNGCCYNTVYNPLAAVAAVAITAAIIGSTVQTLPPACSMVVVNGITYQQCGSTWYQPQFVSGATTYVVIAAPR